MVAGAEPRWRICLYQIDFDKLPLLEMARYGRQHVTAPLVEPPLSPSRFWKLWSVNAEEVSHFRLRRSHEPYSWCGRTRSSRKPRKGHGEATALSPRQESLRCRIAMKSVAAGVVRSQWCSSRLRRSAPACSPGIDPGDVRFVTPSYVRFHWLERRNRPFFRGFQSFHGG